MKAHRIVSMGDTPMPDGDTIAIVHPARQEDVDHVLAQSTEGGDGRSPWVWVRLCNGDLVLGVFPQGDTYMAMEAAARYPGD
jgi:hypothetical protein